MQITIDVEAMLRNAQTQEALLSRQLDELHANVMALRGQIALLQALQDSAKTAPEATQAPVEEGT